MKIIGHRGARNEAPENTLQGFRHAQEHGCLHFELDIQLSADDVLIVYHDKSLKRTSGKRSKLTKQSYAQLAKTDARLNTPGWPSPCYISCLEDIICAVPHTLSWQFEVKTDKRSILSTIAEKLSTLIDLHNLYDTCHVTSTNKWFLTYIRLKNPVIQTGFVCERIEQRPIKSCLAIGANLIALNYSQASHTLINKAKEEGLEVSCWTVNTTQDINALVDMGVESIITDEPTKMIQHYM